MPVLPILRSKVRILGRFFKISRKRASEHLQLLGALLQDLKRCLSLWLSLFYDCRSYLKPFGGGIAVKLREEKDWLLNFLINLITNNKAVCRTVAIFAWVCYRGGMDRVFQGLAGLLWGISLGQCPIKIPKKNSPASPKKTVHSGLFLHRFTFSISNAHHDSSKSPPATRQNAPLDTAPLKNINKKKQIF